MVSRGFSLPDEQHHYIEKDDYNAFIYHQRNLDAQKRTVMVMHDAEKLLAICDGDFDDTSEYQLLIRLLKEQTTFGDDGSRRLRDRKEKEDPSKVLLNPADPEATFRKKAGGKHLGYAANLVETVGEAGSLLTDYSYEQNIYSDSQFLKDHLEHIPVYEQKVIMVADGAYGGELNVKISFLAKMGVNSRNVPIIKNLIKCVMTSKTIAVMLSFIEMIAKTVPS